MVDISPHLPNQVLLQNKQGYTRLGPGTPPISRMSLSTIYLELQNGPGGLLFIQLAVSGKEILPSSPWESGPN